MRVLYAFLFAALLGSQGLNPFAWARSSSGFVTDLKTGKPIAGASLTLVSPGEERPIPLQADGAFELPAGVDWKTDRLELTFAGGSAQEYYAQTYSPIPANLDLRIPPRSSVGTPFSVVLSWNETSADFDWIGISASAGPVFSTKEISHDPVFSLSAYVENDGQGKFGFEVLHMDRPELAKNTWWVVHPVRAGVEAPAPAEIRLEFYSRGKRMHELSSRVPAKGAHEWWAFTLEHRGFLIEDLWIRSPRALQKLEARREMLSKSPSNFLAHFLFAMDELLERMALYRPSKSTPTRIPLN